MVLGEHPFLFTRKSVRNRLRQMAKSVCFMKISRLSEHAIVTEDFLAPAKGVPVVQRMYHDIFDGQDAAQGYAESLRLHEFQYPASIAAFLVCNKEKVTHGEWYRLQREAMELMEEKGQTPLDSSFHIFVKAHIENLKRLPGKEGAA